MRTPQIGVEEEFLLVDGDTWLPAPQIERVIPAAQRLAGEYTEPELHRAQIETASRPCASLDQLAEQLMEHRGALAEAARREGILVVASGTYPGKMGRAGRLITEKERYEAMLEANSLITREQLICGCHIHVSVEDDHDRIRVVNRIRRHLHCLLALSANSPFWEGEDSGFASFRTEVWARWPTAGPPGAFSDRREYATVIGKLMRAGIILDEGMVYWDVRLSRQYPTVEVRIADVGLDAEDSVTIAGLARALVMHCVRTGGDSDDLRPELLRAASWKAARTGLTEDLLDPRDGVAISAPEYIDALLRDLEPDLSEAGDGDRLTQGIRQILASGNGAERQRSAAGGTPDLRAVIEVATVDL